MLKVLFSLEPIFDWPEVTLTTANARSLCQLSISRPIEPDKRMITNQVFYML
jgi:hypothetical protein